MSAESQLNAAIADLEADKAKLEEKISVIDGKIAGLAEALKILGGKRVKAPGKKAGKAAKAVEVEAGKPMKRRPRSGKNMSDLVMEILKADKGSKDGMSPKMILDRAYDAYGEVLNKNSLNQTLGRLKKDGLATNIARGRWAVA